jgi:hypothetical protein
LLGKPISQSSQLRVAFSLPLLTKPMALDTLRTVDKALADVAVLARDTREDPFQSKLDRCFPVDLLHIENPLQVICGDSQR